MPVPYWVVAWLACNGGDTQINRLLPEVSVAPASLDFGEVVVGETGEQILYVGNAGQAPLEATLSFESGGEAFSLDFNSATIDPDGTAEVPVRFSPGTYKVYAGTLVIDSNDEDNPRVTVPVAGEGIHVPTPDIDVDPTLDFGTVAAGTTTTQWITIRNDGDAPLQLGTIAQSGSPAFDLLTDPSGQLVDAHGDLPVIISYTPTTDAGDSGRIALPSDDPDEPEVEVLLLGNGGGDYEYPVAVIDCPGSSEPPEYVTLDGSGSSDPAGYEPLTYQWTLTDYPDGSNAMFEDTDQASSRLYTDVAGDYLVELVVTNTIGISSAPARCEIGAVPDDALHIELSWNGPNADLDLHLRRDGSSIFDEPDDASWCNPNPDWGTSGATDDDPRLDIDDKAGYGPENINVFMPADGVYHVAVHYFEEQGDTDVTATVRVYTYGVLVDEHSEVLTRNQVWEVGQVNWPDGTFGVSTVSPYDATARDCF